ncbi:methionine--tRNA ligase [Alicyclobacillus dauci]|uniref:Methionine--tRNA ligase n=1 Tax=Alicyclobacillus dauci TaxID=1475485 RepID=A0ABY6YXZ6_9BACL|nr:methionine--tRNA ligase [Alicyclobacillus dauci]WAH35431.1 methionine--tRNA ligase [Alicyclobacillus dauci]
MDDAFNEHAPVVPTARTPRIVLFLQVISRRAPWVFAHGVFLCICIDHDGEMITGMTKHLITSALPYINGVKHLGNLAGSLLPADVYARFLRREGCNVLFLCATDEHGTPAELSALEEGVSVRDYCNKMHDVQASILKRFGLSFDHFGRSSSPQNHELTQHFYHQLARHGFIEKRIIQQVYSKQDGRFLPDRYLVGTCPKCGYQAARGDQCENCTTVLEGTDLLEPRSSLSGSTDLEVRSTTHLFLRLSQLSEEVREWVESHPNWSRLTSSIALKWLNEGLNDRCITRNLTWGIPVPEPGLEDKVFYVWFDAPIEYIAAAKEWADAEPSTRNWKTWWYEASDVEYTQFMAKDNVPFHTVFFPAMVLGTRERWTLPTNIKSFNWLTYYGGKFSTSQKRGVFLDAALTVRSADEWRFFLISNSPESDDVSFTWERFAQVINQDLVGNFGNFVNRTLRLTASQFGERIPAGGVLGEIEAELQSKCQALVESYRGNLHRTEFRKAAKDLKSLWSLGNGYLDQTTPWALVKVDQGSAARVLRMAIELIRLFAVCAHPIIPATCERIFECLELTSEERGQSFLEACSLTKLHQGRPFRVPELLFLRVDNEEIEQCKDKFGP